MFWLSRPPYARWAIAGLVLVVGAILEFRPAPTVPHPFAVQPIAVGETIDVDRVRWEEVPAGLLAPVSLPMVAPRPIGANEPIPPGDGTQQAGIPVGWWAIEVALPVGARPGMSARLVTPQWATDGLIVDTHDGDFGERSGLVAVPEADADAVANAVLDASLMVLVGG